MKPKWKVNMFGKIWLNEKIVENFRENKISEFYIEISTRKNLTKSFWVKVFIYKR